LWQANAAEREGVDLTLRDCERRYGLTESWTCDEKSCKGGYQLKRLHGDLATILSKCDTAPESAGRLDATQKGMASRLGALGSQWGIFRVSPLNSAS
jgi:hypothetical protein